MKQKEIELGGVFTLGVKDVKAVMMRCPTVRDIRAAGEHKGEEEKELYLIATLIGASVDELEELPHPVYIKLEKAWQSFYQADDNTELKKK